MKPFCSNRRLSSFSDAWRPAEDGSVFMAGLLPAAAAVMDQPGRRLPVRDGKLRGVEHQCLAHMVGQVPADEAPGAEIENQNQKSKAAFEQGCRRHAGAAAGRKELLRQTNAG
jgi:hypothetical protein